LLLQLLACAMLLFVAAQTPQPLFAKARAKATTHKMHERIDTAEVRNAQDRLVGIARLIPRNVLTARTGDPTTDNIFSNFTVPQIQVILNEYEKKLEKSKAQKRNITEIGLDVGEQFLKVFSDSKVLDEIAIRHADLLYEKHTDEFYGKYSIYTEELRKYLTSKEYENYSIALATYDSIAFARNDTSGVGRPQEPPGRPIPPDPKLDLVIALYDRIINEMPESPYVADALYNKAFILGERYGDYRALKKLSQADIRQKREEAISLLQQLTRKYPDSRYTIDSYMLIGEYLFFAREQPVKTRESIPYYRKVLDLITKNGKRSEYFNQAIYKLGWCYFRLANYQEAITYFTQLVDDIEQAEELFAGRIMPDYIRPDMKNEAIEYIAASFIEIQNSVDRSKVAVELVENFFSKLPRPRRYAPLVYEQVGRKYEELLENPEQINLVWTALLHRFPNYERAPFVADKVIKQLELITLNGEKQGRDKEATEQKLYEERKNLFYTYGRNSKWFNDMRRRIESQNLGIPLPFEEQSVYPAGFDPNTLVYADSISKIALFKNIEYGLSYAQLLDGSQPLPFDRDYLKAEVPNRKRANVFYEQFVQDVDNFTKIFSRYDSAAYFALFQRSLVLDLKLNRPKESLAGYLDVAKNFAWDFHRKEAISNAYAIVDSVARSRKIGFYQPGLDTLARFSGKPDSLDSDEKQFIDVVDAYIRLFPHDSISVNGIKSLADFYIGKGYVDEYKEVNSRLVQFYPIQEIFPGTLINLAANAYNEKDYNRSEQIAKAIYFGPRTTDPKDPDRRKYAYGMVGASIDQKGQFYVKKQNWLAAAKEYERVTKEVPKWEYADKAAENSAFYYVKAGKTDDAVRVNNYLFENANDPNYKIKALKGITYAYETAKDYDRLAGSLERIYDVYGQDSVDVGEDALYRAIRAREEAQNWKEAIRTSDKYLARFDTTRRGDAVAFNKISLNEKSGQTEGIFEAYGAYADKFVTKPRSVTAYFKRGEFLEERGRIDDAKTEFNKAIERYEKLTKDNQKFAGISASESLHRLTKYLLEDYKRVGVGVILKPSAFEKPKEVKAPKQAQVSTSKSKKKTTQAQPAKQQAQKLPAKPKPKDVEYDTLAKYPLKRKMEKNILELAKLGGYRTIEAFYNAGFISEDLADKFSRVPDTLDKVTDRQGRKIIDAKLSVNKVQAYTDAAFYYERAGGDYAFTFKQLTKAREDFLKPIAPEDSAKATKLSSYNDSITAVLGTIVSSAGKIESAQRGEEVLAQIVPPTEKWISKNGIRDGRDVPDEVFVTTLDAVTEKAKSKISEMYFKAGQVNEKSVYTYLNTGADEKQKTLSSKFGKGKKSVTVFLGDVAELIALGQIASRFVRPAAEQAISTYRRGIDRSNELGLKNEYVEKSRLAIIDLATKAVDRSDSLARAANTLFDQYDAGYRRKLDSLTKQPAASDVIDFTVRTSKMNFIIKSGYELTLSAIVEYLNAYEILKKAGAPENKINEVAARASKFLYDMGEGNRQRGAALEQLVKDWDKLGNSEKFWYTEFGALKYDPIAKLYKQSAQAILTEAVTLISDYDIKDENTTKALFAYTKIDPSVLKLLPELKTEITIQSGSDWTVAESIEPGKEYDWFKRDYSSPNFKGVVENDETRQISYLTKITDTTFARKEVSARAIWYEKATPIVEQAPPPPAPKNEPVKKDSAGVAPQGGEVKKDGEPQGGEVKKDTVGAVEPPKPVINYLSVGEVISTNIAFDSTGSKIVSGAESLDSLVAKFKEDSKLVMEVNASRVGLSDKDAKKTVPKRVTEIINLLKGKGVKAAQLKAGKSTTDTVTTLKVTKSGKKTGALELNGQKNLTHQSKRIFNAVVLEQHFAQSGKKLSKKDADLKKAVEAAISAFAGATVSDVKNGAVTLSGEVADDAAKSGAEAAAKAVKNVKSVVNNLTVKPPAPVAQGPKRPDYVYFRKEFDFKGAKEIAQIAMASDFPFDSLEVYVNDTQVGSDKVRLFKNLVPEDSTLDNTQMLLDVSDFVVEGKNLLAIRAPGTLRKGAGLKVVFNLSYFGDIKDSDLKKLIQVLVEKRKKAQKEIKKEVDVK